MDNDIIVKNINYRNTGTNFFVDIKYKEGEKLYHIAQQSIDLDEYLDDDKVLPVYYSMINFSVSSVDLNSEEITNILVSFLAHHKMYLHHFSIIKRETYVSYSSPENESDKPLDLNYLPSYRQESIFIDIEAQPEDDINLYEVLGVKTKQPIESISYKELKQLGYKLSDFGAYSFIIIDDDTFKKI